MNKRIAKKIVENHIIGNGSDNPQVRKRAWKNGKPRYTIDQYELAKRVYYKNW